MQDNPVLEHYALILLPLVMLSLCTVLIPRMRDLFMFIFIVFLAARTIAFILAMWRANTAMSYVAPVLVFLAVWEALPREKWRRWFALGLGALTAGAVWYVATVPWLWRATIYTGCSVALSASLVHSWLMEWDYEDPRGKNLTRLALFVFCSAAAFSTHPAPGWWTATVVTEVVQIGALGLMLWGTYER